MAAIPLQEKIEMILIYGECARKIDNAVILYEERFPDNARSRASFYRVVNRFITEGSVQEKKRVGENTATGLDNEVAVIAAVNVNPHVSTREISHDSGISQSSVSRILRRHKYHPFHISLHQQLHGDDFQNRVFTSLQ